MPKKKKSFIDKSKAQTFAVVHRAQRDPLSQDASAPQHVLVPTHTGNDRLRWSRENRRAGAGEEGSTVVRLDQQNWAELERQGAFGNAEEEGSYDRKEWELATHGLPNDGYDYSKHMKEVGGGAYTGAAEDPVVAESRPELEAVSTADGPIMLPVEALPSDDYHPHLLDVAEFEIDPEVWAAMEDAENETADDVGWEPLEEDFLDVANREQEGFPQAHGEEVVADAETESQDIELEDDEDFKELTEEEMFSKIFEWCDEDEDGLLTMDDFIRLQLACGHETPDTVQWETMCGALKCVAAEGITLSAFIRLYEGEGPHNDYYTLEDQGLIDEVVEGGRRARASLGSNAATDRGESRLLDDQFDALVAEYDDDEIGSLDGEDEDVRGTLELGHFDSILDDFIAAEDKELAQAKQVIGKHDLDENEEEVAAHNKEIVLARYGEESIVSTYSNTENLPARIDYRRTGKKGKKGKKKPSASELEAELDCTAERLGDITLSSKSGLPKEFMQNHYGSAGAVAEGEEGEEQAWDVDEDEEYEEPENKGKARPRHGQESKEDKKARKAAVKAERAAARKTKKSMKIAYRKEELSQEKSNTTGGAMHGVSIVPIS